MENTKKIVTTGIKIKEGGKEYILKGYIVDNRWFGQIRLEELYGLFQSREDWINSVKNNFHTGEIVDIVEVDD